MTRKQLKALRRHKAIVRKRNIRINNIPRGGIPYAVWIYRYGAEYGIDRA